MTLLSLHDLEHNQPDYRLSVGNVASRSLHTWLRHLVPFLLLGIALQTPIALAAWLLDLPDLWAEDIALGVNLLGQMLRGLTHLILQGAVTYGVLESLAGRSPSFQAIVGKGLRSVPSVFFTSLLAGLVTGLAMCALLIPGLIVMTMYFVAVPVAVVEQPGAASSLSRSGQLTSGNRWRIFGLFLLVTVMTAAVGWACVEATLFALGPEDSLVRRLAIKLLSLPFVLLDAVSCAVCYHDLRCGKEGAGVEELVRVFD